MNNIAKIYVGIDVSKKQLDTYLYPLGKKKQFSNDENGFVKLIEMLESLENVDIVAFEASGGYERSLLLTLQEKKFKAWRIEPKRVKGFIRSEGVLVKTDSSDAKMIARFAAEKASQYLPITTTQADFQLQAWINRKEAIVQMISAEKTRLHQTNDPVVEKSIRRHLEYLEAEKLELEKNIDNAIKNDDDWRSKSKILQSAPGIGKGISAMLIAFLPELGKVDNKKIAAIVGVAPYTRQSGTFKGKAMVSGGRFSVRKITYMAAVNAVSKTHDWGKFYRKLVSRGKSGKVALIAVVRKILTTLNSLVRDNRLWAPERVNEEFSV